MNPHNSMSHFEFSDLNNMVLKNGGTRAAPRSKRNVRYVAPTFRTDLPRYNGTATLDLPPHMFGEITSGEGLFIGASAPVIVAATAGIYAIGGMFSAWSQEFFIGNKRSLSYKTIAKRNAILGGVFGLITVGGLAASLAKELKLTLKDSVKISELTSLRLC